MDPELLKQLQQLLAQLLANAQDAAAWAKGEIPLLVQEKIAFGRAWETALLVAALGWTIFAVTKIVPWARKTSDDTDGLTWLIAGVAIVVGAGCSAVQIHDALLVWFAPRLYIVEWLFDLVHSAKS